MSRLLLLLLLGTWLPGARAQELPAPPWTPAQLTEAPALAELLRLGVQHELAPQQGQIPTLDPALFTEISPYASEQQAVRLPDDQLLE